MSWLRPAAWPPIRPGRWAECVRTTGPARIALVGLPDDLGVRLNHGRPGAAEGPAALRAALAAWGTPYDSTHDVVLPDLWDTGDILPADGDDAEALAATHDRVRARFAELHREVDLTIAIGGGHDLTAPAVAGMVDARGGPCGGVNLDAHLDVRETPGSGMPFRVLIEGAHVDPTRFAELGLNPFANSEAHTRWARDQGVTLVGIEALARVDPTATLAGTVPADGPGFLTIDLDGLDGTVAPGVSAVNPMGFDVATAMAWMRAAGRHPGIRHVDLMELSPRWDDGRTARIAAMLVLAFLASTTERP